MDGLDFHPYPIPQSLPFAQGYANTNDATVSNLPRIYQAFYDGFAGTPQPTIGQQAGGGLPLSLNEVGIQTDSTGHAGLRRDRDQRRRRRRRRRRSTATEAYQASWYRQMLELRRVRPERAGRQHLPPARRGEPRRLAERPLLRRPTPKQSAATVHDWIAQTRGRCQGPTQVLAAPRHPSGRALTPDPRPIPGDRGRRGHASEETDDTETRPHRDSIDKPCAATKGGSLVEDLGPGSDWRRVVMWHRGRRTLPRGAITQAEFDRLKARAFAA